MSLIYSKDFFEGKRPWSLIKDEILKKYLPPYLKKVDKLNKQIVLIDGFAGPGHFNDGSFGSPYFMCNIAEGLVPGRYLAILVNKDKRHHHQLTELLEGYIKAKSAFTLNGTASDLLNEVSRIITNQTVFIYLDQFGISGFCFTDLLPFLSREQQYSTELLLNINVPTIHRLSCKNQSSISSNLNLRHSILTRTFGGDYWKDFLLNNSLTPQIQISNLMEAYKHRLKDYLPQVLYCPIYERGPDSTLKYYLVFASRHIDAAILLNDIMFKEYWKHIWNYEGKGTLFADMGFELVLPRDYHDKLRNYILNYLNQGKVQRKRLWCFFVRDHFMKFSSGDFKNAIKSLYKEKKVNFIDVKGSKKINDDSILYLDGKN